MFFTIHAKKEQDRAAFSAGSRISEEEVEEEVRQQEEEEEKEQSSSSVCIGEFKVSKQFLTSQGSLDHAKPLCLGTLGQGNLCVLCPFLWDHWTQAFIKIGPCEPFWGNFSY